MLTSYSSCTVGSLAGFILLIIIIITLRDRCRRAKNEKPLKDQLQIRLEEGYGRSNAKLNDDTATLVGNGRTPSPMSWKSTATSVPPSPTIASSHGSEITPTSTPKLSCSTYWDGKLYMMDAAHVNPSSSRISLDRPSSPLVSSQIVSSDAGRTEAHCSFCEDFTDIPHSTIHLSSPVRPLCHARHASQLLIGNRQIFASSLTDSFGLIPWVCLIASTLPLHRPHLPAHRTTIFTFILHVASSGKISSYLTESMSFRDLLLSSFWRLCLTILFSPHETCEDLRIPLYRARKLQQEKASRTYCRRDSQGLFRFPGRT